MEGGAVIPGRYQVWCCQSKVEKVEKFLIAGLKELEFQGTEAVEVETKEEEKSCPW